MRFPHETNINLDFYSSTNTDTFKNGENFIYVEIPIQSVINKDWKSVYCGSGYSLALAFTLHTSDIFEIRNLIVDIGPPLSTIKSFISLFVIILFFTNIQIIFQKIINQLENHLRNFVLFF